MKQLLSVTKFALLSVSLLLTATAHAEPLVQLPGDAKTATIKFDRGDVLALVPVRINGKEIGHFIMDTGAGSSVIDQNVAEELGLQKLGETELSGIGGGRKKGGIYGVAGMQVGEVTLRPHAMAGVDLSALSGGLRVKIAGLLGNDVWSSFPFTLDYRKQTVTFYDRKHFTPPGEDSLVHLQASGPHRNAPVNIEGIADGNAMLDTGYQGGLIFEGSYLALNFGLMKDRSFVETQQIGVGGMTRKSKASTLDTVQVFGRTFHHVAADFPPEPIFSDPKARPSRVGILGGYLLQHFRLTFDYENNRLWAEWQPDELLPEPKPADFKIEAADLFGMTRLHRAVRWSDEETTRRLIRAGAKLAARQGDGRTALHIAAERNQAAIVRELLAAGVAADIRTANENETPLMIAAQRGNLEIVKMLIAAGAKPSAMSKQKSSALLLAAMFGNDDVLNYLIEHYDQPLEIDAADAQGLTPLMAAALNGHTSTARVLIGRKANINIRAESDGWTALICAAWSGHTDFVKLLVESGADINAKNHNGNTALHAAEHKKFEPIIKLLREADSEKVEQP